MRKQKSEMRDWKMRVEGWLAQVPEALKQGRIWMFDTYPHLISQLSFLVLGKGVI